MSSDVEGTHDLRKFGKEVREKTRLLRDKAPRKDRLRARLF